MVTVLLHRKLVETMLWEDSDIYLKYVIYFNSGVSMLYVRISKAQYGILRDVLLFYKIIRSDLEEMGLGINPTTHVWQIP